MSLRIRVRSFAMIREAIGANVEVELEEGARIKDLLNELTRGYGESFSKLVLDEGGGLRPYVKVLLNGRDIEFLNKLETGLKDGDEVALFPPVGGG